jgi:hypothetical protein
MRKTQPDPRQHQQNYASLRFDALIAVVARCHHTRAPDYSPVAGSSTLNVDNYDYILESERSRRRSEGVRWQHVQTRVCHARAASSPSASYGVYSRRAEQHIEPHGPGVWTLSSLYAQCACIGIRSARINLQA